jgi:ABC-type phosphate transport system substrate-binding protein
MGVMHGQQIAPSARVVADPRNVYHTVMNMPGAIGFVAASMLDRSTRTIALDGVRPGQRGANMNSYPLIAPVEFVSAQPPKGEFQAFVIWMLGPTGQAIERQFIMGIN